MVIPPARSSLIPSALSLESAVSALHSGMAASPLLSDALQRRARHVSYELIGLRADRFGPNSAEAGFTGLERVSQRLDEFFLERIQNGEPESRLIEEAKEAEANLREIRLLHEGDHFFSIPQQLFFRSLTILSPDFDLFGKALFRELRAYRESREEAESKFLKPFHDYRDELKAIIDGALGSQPFRRFVVRDRIKRDLLSKLTEREQKDWNTIYDYVGFRIVVGNQQEVFAAQALIQGALGTHEKVARRLYGSKSSSHLGIHYFFQIDDIEPKHKESGYRARHINISRHRLDDDSQQNVSEIQVMSEGIDEWEEIERRVGYKEKRIPSEIQPMIRRYCRNASDYIIACEEGYRPQHLPEPPDIMQLNQIPDGAFRSDMLDRLCDMDALVRKYHKACAA